MRLPTLVIEGDRTDLKQFLGSQARQTGFQIDTCSHEMAVHTAADPDRLLIWVTSQVPTSKTESVEAGLPPSKVSPFSAHANAVLYCTEHLGDRILQIDRFLAEIKSGSISPTSQGQAWRGYRMPTTSPHSALVDGVRERMTA